MPCNAELETIFSVDTKYKAYLTEDRADAFAVGLLMTALCSNMDIVCEAPLTRRLRYQLNHYLIPVMSANLKGLYPVNICAEITDDVLPCDGAVGMSWTGDTDSLYTLKEHLSLEEQSYRLTHLLIEPHGREMEDNLGLNVIHVNSNLSELWPESSSGNTTLYQASKILALQKLFRVFLKPARHEFSDFSFDENDCSHYDLATLSFLETDTTAFYSAGGGYSHEYKSNGCV